MQRKSIPCKGILIVTVNFNFKVNGFDAKKNVCCIWVLVVTKLIVSRTLSAKLFVLVPANRTEDHVIYCNLLEESMLMKGRSLFIPHFYERILGDGFLLSLQQQTGHK